MATPLEQWWTIEADPDLTDELRTSLLESIREAAFNDVPLPFLIADTGNTVTSITANGSLVICNGTGPLSWPLVLHGPPVGVPDPDGMEVHPNGSTWRTDPAEVIAGAARSVR